jgi:telomerase reverse transcriptase
MKRKRSSNANGTPRKKAKRAAKETAPPGLDHPVLRHHYSQVLTLRQYLLAQLPLSSKNRRRRISQLGQTPPAQDDASTRDADIQLGQLLDSTLIGCLQNAVPEDVDQELKDRKREIESFTQQRSQSISGGTFKPGYFMQSEVG